MARSARRCPRCTPISGPSASRRAVSADDVTDGVGLDELGGDLLDRLGRLVGAERTGTHALLEQLHLEGEGVEAPGEERERLLRRALGVLADGAFAVGRADVDGAVGVHAAPLARQPPGCSLSLTDWSWPFPSGELPCAVTLLHLLLVVRRGLSGCPHRSHDRATASGPVGWVPFAVRPHPDAGDETRADRRLPGRSVGHQLLRRGDRSRHRVRGHRPGQGRRRRRRPGRPRARLKPVAVLVTHGHVDHMWCVAPVAGTYDATAWIHPDDRHLLADPMAGMSPETTAMLLGGKYEFAEPDRVEELADGQTLELAGLQLRRRPHPGPHRGLGHLPHAVRRAGGRLRGDVLRRPAVRRLDRPHRPARAATTRRCCAACATRC